MKLPRLPHPSIRGWKIKIIMTGLVALGLFVAFYFVSAFYDTYRVSFQPPIIFQAPVIVTEREYTLISPVASVSATPTPQSFVPHVEKVQAKEPAFSYPQLVKFVHYRESTYGTAKAGHHIECRQKGMWNEIGYNPQAEFCFNSKEEGMAKLDDWMKTNVPKYGLPGALCRYNSGKPLDDCQYYQDYLEWGVK